MATDNSGIEGKKQKGGLFRRKNKETASSASSSPPRPQQQHNETKSEPVPRRKIFASPIRRRGRGGGGGASQESNDDRSNDAAAAAASSPPQWTTTATGQGYESYFSNNTNMNSDFDDGMSFHSARLLKNSDDDLPNNNKTTTTSKATSWLCRTKYFRSMCDAAFESIDQDESGTVDEKELYSGLLLIHLKLGMYAGPAACKPLERQRVNTMFHEMDADQSGFLDRDEFCHVMMLLFSNVLFRVLVQWSMTLLIVPLIAQAVLDAIYATIDLIYRVVVNLDEYSSLANHVELTIEAICEFVVDRVVPSFVLKLAAVASHYVKAVPEAVWNSIPLTLLSTILGMLVVPYLILQVDDFFQNLASSNTTAAKTAMEPGARPLSDTTAQNPPTTTTTSSITTTTRVSL